MRKHGLTVDNLLAVDVVTAGGEVLRLYRDFIRDAPDELGTVVRFGTAPPLPVIPEDLHWRPLIMVGICYAGPIEDGERWLRPLRASRTPLLDLVAPTRRMATPSTTGWWT
jgi:hypothetical protein